MARLKRFEGNHDGRRRGLVVAKSQKEAAKVVGCAVALFRSFWGEHGLVEIWMKPHTLYTRPIDKYDSAWIEGRCPLG